MQKSKLKVIAGALLHDIGKPAYRGDKSKNHSISGYEFLKDTVGIKDTEILEQVKYNIHCGQYCVGCGQKKSGRKSRL